MGQVKMRLRRAALGNTSDGCFVIFDVGRRAMDGTGLLHLTVLGDGYA